MPMEYDPKTGVPRYVPDLGEEIAEGKTPKPVVLKYGNKTDPFKGDKPLTMPEYERLRDGFDNGKPVDTSVADKLLAEVFKGSKVKPGRVKAAKLDAHVATDSEVDEIEKLAKKRTIENWPLLRRLVNRLRLAEGK